MWKMVLQNSFQKCRSSHSHMFFRSSHPEVFCKKGFLRNFTKFTGKHLYQSLIINKVVGLSLSLQFYWKRDSYRYFPMNFAKFLRTPFLTEHLKIGVLIINFQIFARTYLCWSPFLIHLEAWRPVTLIKRDSNTTVNMTIFLRKAFLWNTSGGCF